jgi:hypothetical protein
MLDGTTNAPLCKFCPSRYVRIVVGTLGANARHIRFTEIDKSRQGLQCLAPHERMLVINQRQ